MDEYHSHFQSSEFACNCCGEGGISTELWNMLESARVIAGVPFVITSGFRCINKQAELIEKGRSSATSSHPRGFAVDISAVDSEKRAKIRKALILAGFERSGTQKDFIHIDIDPEKNKPREWLYND